MESRQLNGRTIHVHRYQTVIVGAGAAGMNCAVHLCEFLAGRGHAHPETKIAVVTGGLSLGASRMSGSDKQTYYKMGTSPEVADSAEDFARSLTAAGCCHGDLALVEAIGSLREFYHLVQAGVPFPHDAWGSYIGYKTDHDPYERATSAGPKTSKFMSECLEAQVRRYGIAIHDRQEVAELITVGSGAARRIAGVLTLNAGEAGKADLHPKLFLCGNIVLATGGPGALYETSVYPKGQVGIHGLALRAGLAAENLTESQFGLASTKFRWNVSGTYMQVIPRIFSTDADGGDEREFLNDFFPSMGKLATNIFLKGYQWPFDPQRIENLQSSLIDVLVFNETRQGRRVYLDFQRNPVPTGALAAFAFDDLEPEAHRYLEECGAFQTSPIERLAHMNPPAIDIYRENGIDLYAEPLEIAVCAQHNNGGMAVNAWYESSVKQAFVIGEMAGSHGVKRPGGSALNAGQTGGLRAAEYIAHVHDQAVPGDFDGAVADAVAAWIDDFEQMTGGTAAPRDVIADIQRRMTRYGGHIRQVDAVRRALAEAVQLCCQLDVDGLQIRDDRDVVLALRARHLALTSAATLKAIADLLVAGSGSRGSHLVLGDQGMAVHPDVRDAEGTPLRFLPENESLRDRILRLRYRPDAADLFETEFVPVRPVPRHRQAFEPAWADYRAGRIYRSTTE